MALFLGQSVSRLAYKLGGNWITGTCTQRRPRKQIPGAILEICMLRAEQLDSGHLPWSVSRMHEDRALPATEVRAGAAAGAGRCWLHFREGASLEDTSGPDGLAPVLGSLAAHWSWF